MNQRLRLIMIQSIRPLIVTLLITYTLLLPTRCCKAQVQNDLLCQSKSFERNERLTYEVYFKWGLIRGKAGNAYITTTKLKNDQWFQRLTFSTSGLFDSIYPMRDTMETLYNAKKQPIRWEKRVVEDNDRVIDVLSYSYFNSHVNIHSHRVLNGHERIDTVLVVNKPMIVADMVSSFALLRAIPEPINKLHTQCLIAIGKDLVPIQVSYHGTDIVKLNNGSKVAAYRLSLDIKDPAFKDTKSSVELWISSDGAKVPLKIQTKLAIGYAQCVLSQMPSGQE